MLTSWRVFAENEKWMIIRNAENDEFLEQNDAWASNAS